MTSENNDSAQKDWEILSDVFDDMDFPNRIIVHIVDFRKYLWKKYRINRTKFQEMLFRLYQSEYADKIRMYGGPGYTKTNWVVGKDGRHYYLIEFRTEKHEEYMRGHRG